MKEENDVFMVMVVVEKEDNMRHLIVKKVDKLIYLQKKAVEEVTIQSKDMSNLKYNATVVKFFENLQKYRANQVEEEANFVKRRKKKRRRNNMNECRQLGY